MTAVINRGANKLDPYISVQSDLALTTQGTRTLGTLTVHVHNTTPPGQSQFIAGPYPGLGTVYGEYLGLLAVNLPGYASEPHIDGNPPLDALGAEGPTWVIATPVDVKAGQAQQVVVRFTLPQGTGGQRGPHGTADAGDLALPGDDPDRRRRLSPSPGSRSACVLAPTRPRWGVAARGFPVAARSPHQGLGRRMPAAVDRMLTLHRVSVDAHP